MLLVGILTGLEYLNNRWMRSRLTGGSSLAMEGIVTNYYAGQDYHSRTDINGRTVKDWYEYEGFRVNGIPFSYTVGASTDYFRNGEKPRLPVRDGMMMRIQYFAEPILGDSPRNRILKLEVQPSSLQPHLSTTNPLTATLH